MEPENKAPQVSRTFSEAKHGLANTGPKPFSPQAFEALEHTIDWFSQELAEQSIKVSKRHRADNVAESHVETAAGYLLGNAPSRIFRHLGTIGGVLLGAALSSLLTLITTNVFTPFSVGLIVVLAIIGAFLMAVHMARE